MRSLSSLLLLLLVANAGAQEPAPDPEPEPELHPLKGAYECSVLQTSEGDILNLNCTETESPLAGDWDFEIYKVTRSSLSSTGRVTIWIRSKVDMHELRLLVNFRINDGGTTIVNKKTAWAYQVDAGSLFSETAYADFTPIQSVEITNDPLYGPWVCQGCGEFEFDDLEISRMVDPDSVQLEDVGRFLEEMQNAVSQ